MHFNDILDPQPMLPGGFNAIRIPHPGNQRTIKTPLTMWAEYLPIYAERCQNRCV